MRDNHVHVGANQFSRQFGKSFVAPFRPAVLYGDVRALDITEIAQPLPVNASIREAYVAAHALRVAMKRPRHQAEQ